MILRVNKAHKHFGELVAVKDVSFEVEKGEVLADSSSTDQGELALKAQKQQQDAKDSADDREVRVVMNTENNLTKERMDTLDLTLEAAKLKKEQAESVTTLQEAVQRGLIQ